MTRGASATRTVADFVAEFDGLTGSRKRKAAIDDAGLQRFQLSQLATESELDDELIDRLLQSMKRHTKPVTPQRLGQIGEEHLMQRLVEFGCQPESVEYRVRKRCDEGVPFVLENAFGYLGDGGEKCRQIHAGANWSPGIKNPFRSFGATGEGLETVLASSVPAA